MHSGYLYECVCVSVCLCACVRGRQERESKRVSAAAVSSSPIQSILLASLASSENALRTQARQAGKVQQQRRESERKMVLVGVRRPFVRRQRARQQRHRLCSGAAAAVAERAERARERVRVALLSVRRSC